MATAFASNTSASFNLYLHRFCQYHSHPPSPSIPPPSRLSFLAVSPHGVKRIAVAPLRPPTPPSPDPPPPTNTTETTTSLVEAASMIEDRVKIFLALLIWISLFFWASAVQGRGRGNGKGDKGSCFK